MSNIDGKLEIGPELAQHNLDLLSLKTSNFMVWFNELNDVSRQKQYGVIASSLFIQDTRSEFLSSS